MVSAPSRITISCTLLLLIVTAGVLGVMATEGLSLSDALYFVVVTIATVGYGDIAPATGAGRLIAVLIIIGGVGTFVSVFATAVEGLVSRSERRARQHKINMMMGLFFSEAGTEFLDAFARLDPRAGELRETLAPGSDPGAEDFRRMRRCATSWTGKRSFSSGSWKTRPSSSTTPSPSCCTRSSTCGRSWRSATTSPPSPRPTAPTWQATSPGPTGPWPWNGWATCSTCMRPIPTSIRLRPGATRSTRTRGPRCGEEGVAGLSFQSTHP